MMGSWIRIKIIDRLYRDPDICWSRLVNWAYFPENHDFREIFHAKSHFPAEADCSYCGKCTHKPMSL